MPHRIHIPKLMHKKLKVKKWTWISQQRHRNQSTTSKNGSKKQQCPTNKWTNGCECWEWRTTWIQTRKRCRHSHHHRQCPTFVPKNVSDFSCFCCIFVSFFVFFYSLFFFLNQYEPDCEIPPPLPMSPDISSSEYHSFDGDFEDDQDITQPPMSSSHNFYNDSEMSALNKSVFELSSEDSFWD